jgi:hypothetical protein
MKVEANNFPIPILSLEIKYAPIEEKSNEQQGIDSAVNRINQNGTGETTEIMMAVTGCKN